MNNFNQKMKTFFPPLHRFPFVHTVILYKLVSSVAAVHFMIIVINADRFVYKSSSSCFHRRSLNRPRTCDYGNTFLGLLVAECYNNVFAVVRLEPLGLKLFEVDFF